MTRPLSLAVAAALVCGLSTAVLTATRAVRGPQADGARTNPVTFKADVAPLLAEKCRPCHFKGGKVFDKLPFDDYKTVAKVGARLNTRLKGKDAELVSRWIARGSVE
jgi:hypothetical protein